MLASEFSCSPVKSQAEFNDKHSQSEPPQIKILETLNTENDEMLKSKTSNVQIQPIPNKKQKTYLSTQVYPSQSNINNLSLYNLTKQASIVPMTERKPVKLEDVKKKIRSRLIQMLNSLPMRKVKNIQAKQFNMINDWASSELFYKQEQASQSKIVQIKRQLFSSFEKYVTGLSKKYPPLNPSHPVCNIIRIANFILSFLIIFFYSLQTFLKVNFEGQDFFNGILLSAITLFSFDIVLNFNIGYYNKGGLVLDRYKIYKNYKYTLMGDILSLISLSYNRFVGANDTVSYILKAVFLIKLFSMEKQKKRIENLMIYKYGMSVYYTLSKLLLDVMWKCHWISLFWYYCAKIEIDLWQEESTWLHIQDVIEKEWYIQYIYAYFWAAQTVITGGNFQPKTSVEVLICIIFMLGSVGLFAFIINRVGQILEEITQGEKQYQKELEVLNKYVRTKNLSKEMQERVLNYLEFQYIGHQDMIVSNQVNQILKNFPKNIKDDLKKEICFNVLISNKIFRQNFTQETLTLCTNLIEEEFFMPGDLIVNMNQHEDISLYIIFKGSVEISLSFQQQERETFIANLPQGVSFGIQSFFSGLPQNFQAKSLNFTTIYKLKRNSFVQLIKDKQDDFEKFSQIKDTLLTTGMCQNVYESCKICGKFMDHNDQYCDLVHYQPNKKKLIYINQNEFNYVQLQRNNSYKRKEKTYFPAIKTVKKLELINQKLLDDPNIKRILLQQYQFIFKNNNRYSDNDDSNSEDEDSYNSENSSENNNNEEDDNQVDDAKKNQIISDFNSQSPQHIQQSNKIQAQKINVYDAGQYNKDNEEYSPNNINYKNYSQQQQNYPKEQITDQNNQLLNKQQYTINKQQNSSDSIDKKAQKQQAINQQLNSQICESNCSQTDLQIQNQSLENSCTLQQLNTSPAQHEQQLLNNNNNKNKNIQKFSTQINNKISDNQFKIQNRKDSLSDLFQDELDQIYNENDKQDNKQSQSNSNQIKSQNQHNQSIAQHFRSIEQIQVKKEDNKTNPYNQTPQSDVQQSGKKMQNTTGLRKQTIVRSQPFQFKISEQKANINNSNKVNQRKFDVFRPINRKSSQFFEQQLLQEQINQGNKKTKNDNQQQTQQNQRRQTMLLHNNNQEVNQSIIEGENIQHDQDQFILDFEARKSFRFYFNQQNFSLYLQIYMKQQKEKLDTLRRISKVITPINQTQDSLFPLTRLKTKKKSTTKFKK